MNKIYRIIQDRTTGELVVVSELASNKASIKQKLATAAVSILGMASANVMAQSCINKIDNGEIKNITTITTTPENCSVFFDVGYDSTGTLNILGDGSVNNTQTMRVGYNPNSVGTINISDNGVLNTEYMTLGYSENALGRLNVTGPNAKLNITDILSIGDKPYLDNKGGTGNVIISDGATANVGELHVGFSDATKASMVVDNATLNISDDIINTVYISSVNNSDASDALLHLKNNAKMNYNYSTKTIGAVYLGKNGRFLIEDNSEANLSGSSFNITSQSQLNISGGSKLMTTGAVISNVSQTGDINVLVTGENSLWQADTDSSIVNVQPNWDPKSTANIILSAGNNNNINFVVDDKAKVVSAGLMLSDVAVGSMNVTVDHGAVFDAGIGYKDSSIQVTVEDKDSTAVLNIKNGGELKGNKVYLGTLPIDWGYKHDGTVTVNIDGAGSKLTVGEGGLFTGKNTILNINNGGEINSAGEITFGGSQLNIDNGIITATQFNTDSEDPISMNFNNDSDTTINMPISGNVNLNKKGAGLLTLNGINDYTGATHIDLGKVNLGNTGALSANSDHTLLSGTELNLGGFNQTVNSLNNAGKITFNNEPQPIARRGFQPASITPAAITAGTVLTVNGDYVGVAGSELVFNSQLGNDSSVTDKLIIQGDASGKTNVKVNNINGAGDITKKGLELITVNGNSAQNVFEMKDRVTANAYEYQLVQDANSYYLRSEFVPTTPPTTTKPLLRSEAGAYLNNQNAAMNMFNVFQTAMHDRVGEIGLNGLNGENGRGSVWVRAFANQLDAGVVNAQIDVNTNVDGVQIGGDTQLDFTSGRFYMGLMGGYGYARTNTMSRGSLLKSKGNVNGKNIGIYSTWFMNPEDADGLYLDSVVQYGRYDNKVESEQSRPVEYDSSTWSSSLEAGYSMKVAEGEQMGVYLEPQAQITHTRYRSNNFVDSRNTLMSGQRNNDTQYRVGARLFMRSLDSDGYRIQPYVAANWYSGDQEAAVNMGNTRLNHKLAKNLVEGKVGVQGEITQGWSAWANMGLVKGNEGYSDLNGNLGLKYSW